MTALIIISSLVVSAAGLVVTIIEWIGRGESDVNGDPERDVGTFPTK